MHNRFAKIVSIAALIILLAGGAALADDNRRHLRHRGHGPNPHHYCRHDAPLHVHPVQHHRPVVVERNYHHPPLRYVRPSGFVFGMSIVDAAAGAAFGFAVSGR